MTKIEWTDETWNPIIGCTKISPGCRECYAAKMHNRNLHNPKQLDYQYPFNIIQELPNRLDKPRRWKKPRKIFVNSMSDLFHKDVSPLFREKVFQVMNETSQHTYQILTKRADLLFKYAGDVYWSDNIQMGVSVETPKYYKRITYLQSIRIGPKTKFLSLEPLLEAMSNLPLNGIDLVIVGGESGPKSQIRKMELDWARDIRDQCIDQEVKFFYKQGGTLNQCKINHLLNFNIVKCSSKGCRILDGKLWEEMP